jgi:hypothetical protein
MINKIFKYHVRFIEKRPKALISNYTYLNMGGLRTCVEQRQLIQELPLQQTPGRFGEYWLV